MVKLSAGIYQNETLSRLRGAHRTVLIVNGDSSYVALLFNWICYARKQNLKFMLASTDELLHRHVREHQEEMGFLSYVPDRSGHLGGHWSKGRYHRMAILTFKLVVVRDILTHTGYNVLFSDVDIAIMADPWWPHIGNAVRVEGCDYVYQQNPHFCCPPDFGCGFSKSYDGNTGFYFARARSAPLLSFFEQIIRASQKDHQHHDQRLWWDKLHTMFRSGAVLYHDTTANWRTYISYKDPALAGPGTINGSSLNATRDHLQQRVRPVATVNRLLLCPLPALTHLNGGMVYVDTNRTKQELSAQRRTPFGRVHPRLLTPVIMHANYRTPPSLGTKIEQLLEKGLWALRETPGWHYPNITKVAQKSREVYQSMAEIRALHRTEERLRHVPVPRCLPIRDLPWFQPGGFGDVPVESSKDSAAMLMAQPPREWKLNQAYFTECATTPRSSTKGSRYPNEAARAWAEQLKEFGY